MLVAKLFRENSLEIVQIQCFIPLSLCGNNTLHNGITRSPLNVDKNPLQLFAFPRLHIKNRHQLTAMKQELITNIALYFEKISIFITSMDEEVLAFRYLSGVRRCSPKTANLYANHKEPNSSDVPIGV